MPSPHTAQVHVYEHPSLHAPRFAWVSHASPGSIVPSPQKGQRHGSPFAPHRPGQAESFPTSQVSFGASTMPSPQTAEPVGQVPSSGGLAMRNETSSLRLIVPPTAPPKFEQKY